VTGVQTCALPISRLRTESLCRMLLTWVSTVRGEIVRALAMLADGLTDREIANALTISPRTVETHVSNILHKLSVRNRAEAAQRYRQGGGPAGY